MSSVGNHLSNAYRASLDAFLDSPHGGGGRPAGPVPRGIRARRFTKLDAAPTRAPHANPIVKGMFSSMSAHLGRWPH